MNPLFSYLIMERLHCILVLFLFSQISLFVSAQDPSEPSAQVWYYLENPVYIRERISYGHDIGFRHAFPVNDLWRIYYRPSMRFAAGDHFDVYAGMAFFNTCEQGLQSRFELRPWQAVRIEWPVYAKLGVDHFIRLEERLFRGLAETGCDPALRARYRLNFVLPLNKPGMRNNTLYLKSNAEFFYHVSLHDNDDRLFHRRFGLGLGYRFDPRWRTELIYVFTNTSRIPFDDIVYPVHVAQVRLSRSIFPD